MLSRRSFLLGGALALPFLARARSARATLSRALTLSELVHASDHAVVGTPLDMVSQWETIGARSRITTTVRVRVDASLDGRSPGTSELQVRLLGGRVGDVGQIVSGEARLLRGESAATFVTRIGNGAFVVTAMAQGHYPLLADPRGTQKLKAHFDEIAAIGDDSAVRLLDGRTLAEAQSILYKEVARGAR